MFINSTNIKIDYNESFAIINEHKSYMLLEANAGAPEFMHFMRTFSRTFKLENEYICYADQSFTNWRGNCKQFQILDDKECRNGESHFKLLKTGEPCKADAIPINELQLENWFRREMTRIVLNHAKRNYDETCRFFQQSDAPFGKFNTKCGKYEQSPIFEYFTVPQSKLIKDNALLIDYPGICGDLSTSANNPIFQPIEFRNGSGNVTMKVMLVYDTTLRSFLVVPVTSWKKHNTHDLCGNLFCIPHPGKQPLLNLDRIVNEDTKIYLTPDLLFAKMNSDKNRICTSWLCDSIDNVDWMPLKDKDVTLLVHNYGGKSLETAVVEMYRIAQYLRNKNLIRNIDFQLLDFDYGDEETCFTADDVIAHHCPGSVKLKDGGNIEVSEFEFENLYNKALKKMEKMATPIYADCQAEQDSSAEKQNDSSESTIPDYVLHPVIARGEQSILMAPIGLGKSNMAISMAAMIVNESTRSRDFFKEKNWGVPKGGTHKVLYLDFENGNMLKKKFKDFAKPYLSDDCERNLIIENCMAFVGTDFTTDEGKKALWQMIADAENKGTPGRPVDVVVIDTLEKFIAIDTAQSATRLAQTVNELRSKNIAVLLVAHSDESGENIRGFKNKTDDAFRTIILNRESGPGNLSIPFSIRIHKDRGSLPEIVKNFEGKFEDGEWKVNNPKLNQKEDLLVWCDYYKEQGLHRDQIAALLGMSKSKLQDLIK